MDRPVVKEQGQSVIITEPKSEEHEPSLNGTFASVLIVGGVIFVTWMLVFLLFIYRI